jgi:fructokinase
MKQRYTVVGLGELLWDLFADGPRLGGAPANVAYHATVLGDHGIVASTVGQDERGDQAIAYLQGRNVDTSHVQRDPDRPTGVARVALSGDQARFAIVGGAAWTVPKWTADWENLFRRAQLLCFGSLLCAQREGRVVLERASASLPDDGWRLLDLNLRPPYDTDEAIDAALSCANGVKLNEQEASILRTRYGAEDLPRWLIDQKKMRVVAITRGARGSLLYDGQEMVEHPGAASVDRTAGDVVGAGDAFTAALGHHLLRAHSLEKAGAAANRYAALVASRAGAMPDMDSADVSTE